MKPKKNNEQSGGLTILKEPKRHPGPTVAEMGDGERVVYHDDGTVSVQPAPKPPKGQRKMFITFGKGKPKVAPQPKTPDPEEAQALADPEFVEMAKSVGLTPEQAVKFTKLFRS